LLIAGKTILAQGTPVAGSVVAARPCRTVSSRDCLSSGYLRLTLASIVIRGKSVSLRTSTLFAKGQSYEKRKATTIESSATESKSQLAVGEGNEISINPGRGDVRFSTGRRLSFRLAQPLSLSR